MKNLILISAILLVVGCGKGKEAQTKTKVTENNTTKPAKGPTLREKLIGEYEWDDGKMSQRWVMLKNGETQTYENDVRSGDFDEVEWRIIDGEVHVGVDDGEKAVVRFNVDGSLTVIARVNNDGKRTDIPKENQLTLNRIK